MNNQSTHAPTRSIHDLAQIIGSGGIGILPTDTIYGIVGLASSKSSTDRVYDTKGRTPDKPPIVLITSIDQMLDTPSPAAKKALDQYWPGANSIILPAPSAPNWLTRGTTTVAYRLISTDATPQTDLFSLYHLINITGPLIAPSANPEGLPPAKNIDQARAYFGNNVDFYINGGTIKNTLPSRLYLWSPEKMHRLR